jgi:hypothetical protein
MVAMTMLPVPPVLFGRLQYEAGTESGAREVFQTLITDLVALQHPAANEVAGPGGGDWGIDTYVGCLDDSVVVWQSKFFLNWKGDDQRDQVRRSFNQLMQKAKANGLTVDAWTLCVPCVLSPDEQKWFDGWSAGRRRKTGVQIVLWNGVRIRRMLMKPDAEDLYRAYFLREGTYAPYEEVKTLDDVSSLGKALFVRQLEEAGHVETDAARGLFFAAEALARDLAAAGNRAGVNALNELHLEVQSLWEARFNARALEVDTDGRMAGLVDDVLREAGQCSDPDGLWLRPAHRKGVAHRLVENARAGWVLHWRDVAAGHQGPPAGETIAAHLVAEQPEEVS